ncbi:MAG TPA: energy-coupling factor ABC transporter ATP-binding protein [Candidatus Limiplasma sp.]|nr:energy-coupling factor ABC transporter ATP-binding protein [Candidatus Limiplasma sp.]HRX08949.1 energy-coupling factor ABC transporter ATP-binding protein [Candidatus Limiplasma sp.]
MAAILTAKNLKFMDFLRFPDLSVERGSAAFLCGPSGTGKSTLMKLFNATHTPTEGTITFDGQDIAGMDTIDLRRSVLLAGQKVYLFDDTIRGNFEQFYAFRGDPCISDEDMREFLRLCCIEFPLETRCQPLSGGEKQRVFLAVHLSMKPQVLMMDEPTAALDKKTSRLLLSQVKDYCKQNGITMLVISHDISLVGEYADQVISLSEEACE